MCRLYNRPNENCSAEKDEAEEEFTRLQFLLSDLRKEDECCLDNDQYLDDVLDDIELHEVPSAITALNNLKSNHQTEYKKLKFEIDLMKSKVGADQKEIKNLQNTIKSLTK